MKIFLDCADKETILRYADDAGISGFTTNPTLMRKAGVTDYVQFAQDVLAVVKEKPVSFEVFADDFAEMERQAKVISGWGENVYVKVPVTNTKGESSVPLINKLSAEGVKVNVTAVTYWGQYRNLEPKAPMIVSIFAGRIADTGRDPIKSFQNVFPSVEHLWASPREVLNIYQAAQAGADIITVTPELYEKYKAMRGKELYQISLDTVRQFFEDGKAAGYSL